MANTVSTMQSVNFGAHASSLFLFPPSAICGASQGSCVNYLEYLDATLAPYSQGVMEGTVGSLSLIHDEYISDMEVYADGEQLIQYLKLATNKGNMIELGSKNDGSSTITKLSGIRLQHISLYMPQPQNVVTGFNVDYIENYVPSSCIGSAVNVILYYSGAGSVVQTENNSIAQLSQALYWIASNINSIENWNYSALAAFASRASLDTYINIQTLVPGEVAQALQEGIKGKTLTIPEGEVLVVTAQLELWQNGSDFWFYFNGYSLDYTLKSLKDTGSDFYGYYDLTGTLSTQFPALAKVEQTQNTFTYYANS